MCATLRKTVSRGRDSDPCTRLRRRYLIRWRRSSFVLIFTSGSRLADLLLQHFAGIPDTLLLVRIRLAHPADIGGHLPHQLTVRAGDGDVRLLVDGDVDAVGDVEHD